MRATFGGAFLALAALALGGCTAQGVQPVSGPSTATVVSLATPTTADTAAGIIDRRGDELVATIERFRDGNCAYGGSGTSCSQDRARIKRLADMMRGELEAAAPWAPSVEALAERTTRRLGAVSIMTADPGRAGAMLDTEMMLLAQDLKSWSTVND